MCKTAKLYYVRDKVWVWKAMPSPAVLGVRLVAWQKLGFSPSMQMAWFNQEHTTMCYSFYLLFTDPPAGWHPASWQDVL